MRVFSLARYRLRFLLHEIDLPLGELVIGRSASCYLTVDDPLVSRQHAQIVVDEERAFVEDLGSRNGVRVDGRAISGRTLLRDGTALRIGTQEMRVRKLEEERLVPVRRAVTGFLVHCAECGVPYGTDQASCPHCDDDAEQTDVNVSASAQPQENIERAWSMELLAETLSLAQDKGRTKDLLRLLAQAREVVENSGVAIDRRRLDQLASAAAVVATNENNWEWLGWTLSLFADRAMLPRPEIGQTLSTLPQAARDTLAPTVDEMVRSVRASLPPQTPGENGGFLDDDSAPDSGTVISRVYGDKSHHHDVFRHSEAPPTDPELDNTGVSTADPREPQSDIFSHLDPIDAVSLRTFESLRPPAGKS
ncbi:MAG: FHA domain-containing protein [Polyangiaceae bacterium]|nr:FHA domain-containing protein [Polyangiaceae bacterium]